MIKRSLSVSRQTTITNVIIHFDIDEFSSLSITAKSSGSNYIHVFFLVLSDLFSSFYNVDLCILIFHRNDKSYFKMNNHF